MASFFFVLFSAFRQLFFTSPSYGVQNGYNEDERWKQTESKMSLIADEDEGDSSGCTNNKTRAYLATEPLLFGS
jgi:hypothetical protein